MKEKSFKRKNELLKAALDEFTKKSYENASLNKIIKNAGISKGTFYYHFQDKQTLYIFLLESAYETKLEFINKHMEELAEDFKGKNIFERFKLHAQIEIEFAIAFPEYLKLSMMFMKEKKNKENKKIFERVNSIRVNTTEVWLEEMITEAIKEGNFNNRFSKDFIMKIISYLLFNITEIMHWKRFDIDEDYALEKIGDDFNNLIDFLKYGLSKQN